MAENEKLVCGIIMPISPIDDCTPEHWSEVYDIISDAVEEADMEARLVSDADEVGIIQKRIVRNLYDNPMVVCDVSGKNANVMFELGMRLAFDKPTIIIKDDRTTYSFDTAPIEHLEYPRDLRFARIVDFKEKLAEKISFTLKKSREDSSSTSFLKAFGEFKTANLEETKIPAVEYILDELRNVRIALEKANIRPRAATKRAETIFRPGRLNICLKRVTEDKISDLVGLANAYSGVTKVQIQERGLDHKHIVITSPLEIELTPLKDTLESNISEPTL